MKIETGFNSSLINDIFFFRCSCGSCLHKKSRKLGLSVMEPDDFVGPTTIINPLILHTFLTDDITKEILSIYNAE